MAAKKKPPARSQRGRSSSSPLQLLIWPLLALACLAGLGFLWFKNRPVEKSTFDLSLVDTLCTAAGIDPETDILKKEGEPVRWLIELEDNRQNRNKRDNLLKSLQKEAKKRGIGRLEPESRDKDGKEYTTLDLPLESETLRLIFEMEPVQVRPKPTPASRPPNQAQTAPKPSSGEQPPKTTAPALAEKGTTASNPDLPVYETEAPPLHISDQSDAHPQADPKRPLVAVIIDDIGHREVSQLQSILKTKLPITFAVLPYLPFTKANSYYFFQHNYEVMLHMPMEPDNYPKNNPGEGALFTNQSETEIRSRIDRALRNVPNVVGVNNHMGSKMTANRTLMGVVLAEVQKRNLYFVDSKTNSASVGFQIAKNMGLRTAERNVFLDAENSYEFALLQLQETRKIARQQGYAVVIGHPYPGSLRALAEEMPKMDKEGFQFIFASKIVRNHRESDSKL